MAPQLRPRQLVVLGPEHVRAEAEEAAQGSGKSGSRCRARRRDVAAGRRDQQMGWESPLRVTVLLDYNWQGRPRASIKKNPINGMNACKIKQYVRTLHEEVDDRRLRWCK